MRFSIKHFFICFFNQFKTPSVETHSYFLQNELTYIKKKIAIGFLNCHIEKKNKKKHINEYMKTDTTVRIT